MRRLILRSFQSPGDILMLTAAVRELHLAHPGRFLTDVRTSAEAIWDNNPWITRLSEESDDVEVIDMHYPLVHHSNQRPYHFLHGFVQYLGQRLGISIPVTQFRGDVFLSDEERQAPLEDYDLPETFWIIVAGGKYDYTAKWWNPASYQAVVDHFRHRIQFVQSGESHHWHPPLKGVINLVGKTTLRQFVRLMHHASGVVCPVTFAMHLAAAVEMPRGAAKSRPSIVIAGGREPTHWEAYPNHQFLQTIGLLTCCEEGGCWKSRCQLVGDGDEKDRHNVCEQPVQVTPELRIARCMNMISPADVIRRMELCLEGDVVHKRPHSTRDFVELPPPPPREPDAPRLSQVRFTHGLGDCVYFAHLVPLYARRGHQIEVECDPDKTFLFEEIGVRLMTEEAPTEHAWDYPQGGTHEGHGQYSLGSKIANNISEPPLPYLGPKEDLWDELCSVRVDLCSRLSDEVVATARRWLEGLPRPIVLFHQKGNTGQERKSLPDATAAAFYQAFLDHCEGTLILLDWDQRVPRLASYRVRHLDEFTPCSIEQLLALMTLADLMIGVDSGPLHLARFTSIPTIGVWQPGHYPATYTLPRPEQVNVVLSDHTWQWNRYKRIPWNLVEHPGQAFDAERLADTVKQMLSPPRYLRVLSRNERPLGRGPTIAQDVQLQQFIREFCRCNGSSSLAENWDRQRSLDVLFQETGRRFRSPLIVETGTIRAEEDFGGAGFFTYIAGAYVYRAGGKLHSVDLSADNVEFSRTWTAIFGEAVTVHQGDSVGFLSQFREAIDVLYLDSLDTTEPEHAAHCLREVEAALPRLHAGSLICIDDTPWNGGALIGKGATAVPWLVDHGWQVIYAGYQVVLKKSI